MANKKPTHVVVHKKLYLGVGGKLQHVKVGAQLTLSEEQAERLGKKVMSIKEAKTIDMTKDNGPAADAE